MRSPDDAGDRAVSAVLEDVIRRFGASIRAAAGRYRLPPSEISAAEQEVRLRLWRAGKTAENIARFPTSYLQRVVTTAVLDLLRRRRHASTHDPVEEFALPVDGPGPEADVEAASLAAVVREGVATLALPRRLVVSLHLEGYARHEIEALLGWTEAKTRNLLYRGLADLRAYLVARGIEWGSE